LVFGNVIREISRDTEHEHAVVRNAGPAERFGEECDCNDADHQHHEDDSTY
jgi:hypothetical protein